MCGGGGGGGGGSAPPPPPPPLPAPPPPPLPPRRPVPAPRPLDKETEVNPQVRRAKSKKSRNPYLQGGTGSLRIPLNPGVNTGTSTPTGGFNK